MGASFAVVKVQGRDCDRMRAVLAGECFQRLPRKILSLRIDVVKKKIILNHVFSPEISCLFKYFSLH